MKLHPKIQELRNSVGANPIHYFTTRKASTISAPKPKIAEESSNPRLVKMYHAVWGDIDDRGTRPIKGCFAKSIQERGPGSKSPGKIVVLNAHDQKDPLCLPSKIEEDEIGLYAEWEPDAEVGALGDRIVGQVRRGTVNNGSYGFYYVWDKMEWNERDGCVDMYEAELFEISPVVIGSQRNTFAVRNAAGIYVDEHLEEETEDLIKQLPRKLHLEIRSLINRHISLAQLKPLETVDVRKALDSQAEARNGLDLDYIFNKL